jgi:hypothetical protein
VAICSLTTTPLPPAPPSPGHSRPIPPLPAHSTIDPPTAAPDHGALFEAAEAGP